ncbi:MAG: hypothetical protein E6G65_05930 [Actinobacteria bacterium]|nr:MAG: hypothetical protein E6G65_05930 [Actinomycetota bacterium]
MRHRRISVRATLVLVAVTVLAVWIAPTVHGAPSPVLRFLNQPRDAEQNATITSSDFVSGSSFIQVELVDSSGARITNSTAKVTFDLATGTGFAAGTLLVDPQPLVNGVATFGAGTLKITTKNEPHFTSYALVPSTTKGQPITGPASGGFDVYESGDSCATTCTADIRSGLDVYTVNSPGTLGASQLLASALPGLNCPGQAVIFATSVFVDATTDADSPSSPDPVFVSNHITKADWKASHNNGQAHADWCVALTAAQLVNNGGTYVQQDTNGDGTLDLFVGLAPKCPSHDPQLSAPCIVSQTGDGLGGSTTLGWLPGGDPPRRT